MTQDRISFFSKSEEETIELGKKIAKLLKSNDCLALNGEPGAGKSVLVRAIAKALDVDNEILSPTFNIVNRYEYSGGMFNHFDVYRIKNTQELFETGFFEYIDDGISAVEWAEKITQVLPENTIFIDMKYLNNGREITIRGLDIC